MRSMILDKLSQIEQEHEIRLLFACESGSRGWEFPSPDSDYDVRFIYIRPYRYYLSVMEGRHDLRFPISDELDIYGWDLRKVLQLIRKSNTTPFEWLQSPIVYRENEAFRQELWGLCGAFFSQRSNIHHYLGIAKGAMEAFQPGNQIGIKKLFYVLRPLLAAQWCYERNGIAPMTIGPLLGLLPEVMQEEIKALIAQKEALPESYPIAISEALRAYIEHSFSLISEASSALPRNEFPVAQLDDFFIKSIAS